MGKVIVLGSSNTDLVLRTRSLPTVGETVLGAEFARFAGGKGANQAVAASRAGANVTFVGAVGDDDFGQAALRGLLAEKIEVGYTRVIPGASSGVALIFVDEQGQNQIGVGLGANQRLRPEVLRDLPENLFEPPGVFVAQLESPLDTVQVGLRRARLAGLQTVFNPAPAQPVVFSADWLEWVDTLVVNTIEVAQIAGLPSEQVERDRESVFRLYRRLGLRNLILTLGADGYVVFSDHQVVRGAGIRVSAIDTVGAGDTFVGYLASELSDGKPLGLAAELANRAAAIAVTRKGAQAGIPFRREIGSLDP